MSELIASSDTCAILGTGVTGQSVARYLQRQKRPFIWLDTRDQPPALELISKEFPEVVLQCGELDAELLSSLTEIIVSPGLSLQVPALMAAKQAGVSIVGDIELFVRAAKAPIVAITGSNAKSTVTTLVGEMINTAGKKALVGGNIGLAALDLLSQPEPDFYVLELSSFQLETISRINAYVACVLNISEDHMDRYASLADYHRVKQRIYLGAKHFVFNRDDPLTAPPLATSASFSNFGDGRPDRRGFGVIDVDGCEHLAHEFKALMPVADLAMSGRHNISNSLAALAIGEAIGLPMDAMLETLRTFHGLRHRCETVLEWQGVTYINDSKGTNVGATLAALKGVSRGDSSIVLIAGGVGKGADFSPLLDAADSLKGVVTIGADGERIADVFSDRVTSIAATSMQDAVSKASSMAEEGDLVLLSPACASFDMFSGFEHRGEVFCHAVNEVAK